MTKSFSQVGKNPYLHQIYFIYVDWDFAMQEFKHDSFVSGTHISSFTIAILGSHLIGIGYGNVLEPSFRVHVIVAGLLALAYYLYSESRHHHYRSQYVSTIRHNVERRLQRQVQIERGPLVNSKAGEVSARSDNPSGNSLDASLFSSVLRSN